ncbi:hypothetical protein SUDANB91_02452 [Streptomyces sp. SudanB91_2054]
MRVGASAGHRWPHAWTQHLAPDARRIIPRARSAAKLLTARVADASRRQLDEATSTDPRWLVSAFAAALDAGLQPRGEGRHTTARRQGRPKAAVARKTRLGSVVLTLKLVLNRRFSSDRQNFLVAAAHLPIVRVDHQGCRRWVAATVRFTDHPAQDRTDPVVQESLSLNASPTLNLLCQFLVGDHCVIRLRYTYEDRVRLRAPSFACFLGRRLAGHMLRFRLTYPHSAVRSFGWHFRASSPGEDQGAMDLLGPGREPTDMPTAAHNGTCGRCRALKRAVQASTPLRQPLPHG